MTTYCYACSLIWSERCSSNGLGATSNAKQITIVLVSRLRGPGSIVSSWGFFYCACNVMSEYIPWSLESSHDTTKTTADPPQWQPAATTTNKLPLTRKVTTSSNPRNTKSKKIGITSHSPPDNLVRNLVGDSYAPPLVSEPCLERWPFCAFVHPLSMLHDAAH